MEPLHKCQLDDLCGCKLKPTSNKGMYMCVEFHEELLLAFRIDAQKDSPAIHHHSYNRNAACHIHLVHLSLENPKLGPYSTDEYGQIKTKSRSNVKTI